MFLKGIILALLLTGGSQILFAQYARTFTPFYPAKNNLIKRFDTLKVVNCYNLDPSTTIGVIFRYYLADMWVGIFKNNRSNEPIATFDTVNVSDATRFYFYRTSNPSDGVVIIWESRYSFDSELRAYLFKNGNVVKMGKIDIDLDAAMETQVHYPVSKIVIRTEGPDIKFTFREHLKFRISQPFAPDEFYYLYEGKNELIPFLKGVRARPVW